ncbi:hypothetical protein [Massilia sp. TWP1-3-3]|uniref:hypothetical protein n=1 Tax=Massilia sp. TWP1-3-3 TaxID=2804573 RepID=UPI003CF72F49
MVKLEVVGVHGGQLFNLALVECLPVLGVELAHVDFPRVRLLGEGRARQDKQGQDGSASVLFHVGPGVD